VRLGALRRDDMEHRLAARDQRIGDE